MWRAITWLMSWNSEITGKNGKMIPNGAEWSLVFWYVMENDYIYLFVKNQRGSKRLSEVMAKCPLRGHASHGVVGKIVMLESSFQLNDLPCKMTNSERTSRQKTFQLPFQLHACLTLSPIQSKNCEQHWYNFARMWEKCCKSNVGDIAMLVT